MKLAIKVGLGAVIFGILANISLRDLPEKYTNQKESAALVLENAIQKNPGKIGEAIDNFEKCNSRIDYANGVVDLSYAAIVLGGALTCVSVGRIINRVYIE